MRSKNRNILVVLVAMFALVIASASASAALPEIKPYTPNETITGTGTSVSFQSTTKASYSCESSSFTGTMVGLKELAKVVLTMTCQRDNFKFCLQGYEKPWVSKELKGRIAYLSKTSHTVGLLLEPAVAGGPIAICENPVGSPIEIRGSVIAAFKTGEGFKFKEATLQYEGSEGKQRLTDFEGEEALHRIERKSNTGTEVFSMSTTMKLKFQKEKELVA